MNNDDDRGMMWWAQQGQEEEYLDVMEEVRLRRKHEDSTGFDEEHMWREQE